MSDPQCSVRCCFADTDDRAPCRFRAHSCATIRIIYLEYNLAYITGTWRYLARANARRREFSKTGIGCGKKEVRKADEREKKKLIVRSHFFRVLRGVSLPPSRPSLGRRSSALRASAGDRGVRGIRNVSLVIREHTLRLPDSVFESRPSVINDGRGFKLERQRAIKLADNLIRNIIRGIGIAKWRDRI